MEHEMETTLDVQALEYGNRPEARTESIAELRLLLDEMDGHLNSDLMGGLRVQVERVIGWEDTHAS